MGRADFLELGTWNALCMRCGFKFKANQLRLEWDGLRVCPTCYEPRQPQDFVRAKTDVQAPPWTNPDSNTLFTPAVCSTRSGVAGEAIAGCAIAGLITGV